MKKQLLISSGLALSAFSFSFWRLDPYFDPDLEKYMTEDEGEVYTLENLHLAYVLNKPAFFLYDKHTSNRLVQKIFLSSQRNSQFHIIDDFHNEKNLNKDFFTHSFTYNLEFWEKKNISTLLNFSYSPGTSKLTLDFEEKKIWKDFRNMKPNYVPLTFSKNLTSSSGLEIKNIDEKYIDKGVVLEKGKKIICLSTALKNYFKKSFRQTNLAKAYTIYKDIKDSIEKDKAFIKFVEPALLRLNDPILEEGDFDLLNESQILAVWCLIPVQVEEGGVKKTIESQIMGLAKDKEGNLFHWGTDLRKDISVLMDYAPDISKMQMNNNTNNEKEIVSNNN